MNIFESRYFSSRQFLNDRITQLNHVNIFRFLNCVIKVDPMNIILIALVFYCFYNKLPQLSDLKQGEFTILKVGGLKDLQNGFKMSSTGLKIKVSLELHSSLKVQERIHFLAFFCFQRPPWLIALSSLFKASNDGLNAPPISSL